MHQTECPPESYWDLEQRRLLDRDERARLQDHCVRCEACRLREDRVGTHDGIPARVLAGLAASVLLAGVVRWQAMRPMNDDAIFVSTPYSLAAARTVEPEVAGQSTAPVEDATPAEEEERPAVRVRRAAPRQTASVHPAQSNRMFVPPPRKAHRVEPVRLDPPPTMTMARLDAPNLPSSLPNLQPPRRNPLKKFVLVLAVPFRRI